MILIFFLSPCHFQFSRELATQIFEVLSAFLRCHPAYVAESPDPAEDVIPEVFESPIVKAMLLIGGTGASSVKKDLTEFRENGADILVATPGRLEEFLLGYSSLSKGKQRMNSSDRSGIGKAHINLKGLEVLVLDEADRYALITDDQPHSSHGLMFSAAYAQTPRSRICSRLDKYHQPSSQTKAYWTLLGNAS